MQCAAIACLAPVLWIVAGYSLAFSQGNALIGGLSKAFLIGVTRGSVAGGTKIPETLFIMFQMTFAIITPALIVGAYVERIKFSAVMLFSGAVASLVWMVIEWIKFGKPSLVGLVTGTIAGLATIRPHRVSLGRRGYLPRACRGFSVLLRRRSGQEPLQTGRFAGRPGGAGRVRPSGQRGRDDRGSRFHFPWRERLSFLGSLFQKGPQGHEVDCSNHPAAPSRCGP